MNEIVIHGLGYVGLTAAVHYARAGWNVLGYDPDLHTVNLVNAGHPRAREFLSYLDASIHELVLSRKIVATTDFTRTHDYLFHVLAVPTEKDGQPYDEIIEHSLCALIERTPDNTLIMIESTVTPGFIDRLRAMPIFEARVGNSAFVAVCPRRDWFADPQKNLETLPRIVGGVTRACTARAVETIKHVSKTIYTTDYRTAELCKALENALLHVPLMFAYQLAHALPDHNVAEALRLAGTHWRLTPLYLGFGTGGRCVPLGTQYLVRAAKGWLDLGKRALEWDEGFRALIADIVEKAMPKKVLVLGMAYRPEFRDMGLSPGLAVAKHLHARRIFVRVHDTMWSPGELKKITGLRGDVSLASSTMMHEFDVVLLATPHKHYHVLPSDPTLWRRGQIVLDGPGAWSDQRHAFEKYGVIYKQVGEPGWMTLGRG